MKMKRFLSLAILFLGIGYASVSTTLSIIGDVNLAFNNVNFDVRITEATLDGNAATISEDGHTVTFNTSSLSTVGNKTTLDFTAVNNSEHYDADVSLVCTTEEAKQDNFEITSNPITIPGKRTEIGQVSIELKKGESTNIYTSTFADDSWATIAEAVKLGTYPYHVGDTKTINMGSLGTHTLRVANTSPCTNGETSQTACGFVVEFADIITTHNMNSSRINLGGWPASSLRKYVSSNIYNALPSDLKAAIIDTTVVSGFGNNAGEENFTSIDKLYLLSPIEVWGNGIGYDTAESTTRQLDYYRKKGVTSSNYGEAIKQYNGTNYYWWLRPAHSPSIDFFFIVYKNGNNGAAYADITNGVSPAFRFQSSAPIPDAFVCTLKATPKERTKKAEEPSFTDDSWDTIVDAVKSGNTSVYTVGSTKEVDLGETLGKHTLRVANNSTPAECNTEGFSQTACGFVLEFADIITTRTMNSTATNVGGWPASAMREYVNNDIYNALPSDLKAAIIDTTVVSGHGSTSGETNFTSTDKLYLLSTKEVWGTSDSYDTVDSETRQLDYYRESRVTSSNYGGAIKKEGSSNYIWWLRSSTSFNTSFFYTMITDGRLASGSADNAYGVSPAFRIA